MPSIDLSVRDRHSIKWHLNIQRFDNVGGRRLDKVFDALRLDDVVYHQNVDPSELSAALVSYPITDEDRDFLIDQISQPMLGFVRRQLGPIQRSLIKLRDADTKSAT